MVHQKLFNKFNAAIFFKSNKYHSGKRKSLSVAQKVQTPQNFRSRYSFVFLLNRRNIYMIIIVFVFELLLKRRKSKNVRFISFGERQAEISSNYHINCCLSNVCVKIHNFYNVKMMTFDCAKKFGIDSVVRTNILNVCV